MESQKVQPDFFISHSKETKYKIAVPFMQALISLGFDVWLDRRGILVGERIYSKIEDVIKVSHYCIAIIDSSYLERTWTIKELQLFYEKEATAILPIFVNLKKEVVYNKIPWLDGVAFEQMVEETFSLNNHMDIFCRIISRFYGTYTTSKLENCFEGLLKYAFPCKDTLTALVKSKDYYSQDFRLAIVSLCNINSIVYGIFTAICNQNNKFIDTAFRFNNLLRTYCFDVENIPNYNIYTGAYNSVLVSIRELENTLQDRQLLSN